MTKQELAYVKIRERILSGAYSPGYRVVIDSIAQEIGVSALPVREAIRRLEAEGLVIYQANAGARVAPAEPGVFDEEMTVMAVLEGYATALAAPQLSPESIQRLTEIIDDMVAAMNELNALRFGELNHEFHSLIYDSCPNEAIISLLRDVGRRLDAIRRTVFVQIPYRGAASVAEHRDLLKLITDRAPAEEIETAARNHKLNTLETFRAWQTDHETTTMPA